jgi:hypothetical protein
MSARRKEATVPGRNEEAAEAAREAANGLGDLLYRKQLAYGNSGAIALPVWEARLAQYRVDLLLPSVTPHDMVAGIIAQHPREASFYVLPASLIAHIPRLTRVDDRVNRIISNPAADLLGEDPWLDMAGDAIIGHIMPRVAVRREAVQPVQFHVYFEPAPDPPPLSAMGGCVEPGCELGEHASDQPHRRVHAGGVQEWHSPQYTHGYIEGDEEHGGA